MSPDRKMPKPGDPDYNPEAERVSSGLKEEVTPISERIEHLTKREKEEIEEEAKKYGLEITGLKSDEDYLSAKDLIEMRKRREEDGYDRKAA